MKLAIAALLLLAPSFGQSRWWDPDYAEARREAREVRADAARARAEARRDAAQSRRDAAQARREAQRDAAYARRDAARAGRDSYRNSYRNFRLAWDGWDREELRRQLQEAREQVRRLTRDLASRDYWR